jgi:hypothetical protein
VDLPSSSDPFAALFAEELGLVLEVAEGHAEEVMQRFTAHGVACSKVGQVRAELGVACHDCWASCCVYWCHE